MLAMFSERLLDHFRYPRNVGEMGPPAVTIDASNPACGDVLRLSVRFENGKVAQALYKSRGCTASVAAGSVLTAWMLGKNRAQLRSLTAEMLAEDLGGLPPESGHAAALAVDAVREILRAVSLDG